MALNDFSEGHVVGMDEEGHWRWKILTGNGRVELALGRRSWVSWLIRPSRSFEREETHTQISMATAYAVLLLLPGMMSSSTPAQPVNYPNPACEDRSMLFTLLMRDFIWNSVMVKKAWVEMIPRCTADTHSKPLSLLISMSLLTAT